MTVLPVIRVTSDILSIGDRMFKLDNGVIKSITGHLCISADEVRAIREHLIMRNEYISKAADRVVNDLLNDLNIKVK